MTMGTRTKPANRIRPGASRIVSSVFLRSFGPRHHGARSGPAAAEFAAAAGPEPGFSRRASTHDQGVWGELAMAPALLAVGLEK
jgi:hypothetical protein